MFNFKLNYQLIKLMKTKFEDRKKENFEKEKEKIKEALEEQGKTDWEVK